MTLYNHCPAVSIALSCTAGPHRIREVWQHYKYGQYLFHDFHSTGSNSECSANDESERRLHNDHYSSWRRLHSTTNICTIPWRIRLSTLLAPNRILFQDSQFPFFRRPLKHPLCSFLSVREYWGTSMQYEGLLHQHKKKASKCGNARS